MKHNYDYSKLKGRITEIFGSQRAFAKALNKSDTYITRYLSGQSQFTQDVIILWCKHLNINISEIDGYFFVYLVD